MKPRLWKPLLILAVLAGCMVAMYPPQIRLKPGIDLAGGTTLVYTVTVAPGADATREIEGVIDVLRKRVDPAGQRNLIWRRQGNNRIEIQMALAPKEVQEKRKAYIDAIADFKNSNLSLRTINEVTSIDDAEKRSAAIAKLPGASDDRAKWLNELYDARRTLTEASAPYEEAQDLYDLARADLAKLPDDAPADKRKELEDKIKALHGTLIAKTDTYIKARGKVRGLETSLLSTNLAWSRVDAALVKPVTLTVDGKETTPRKDAIEALKKEHADLAKVIDAAAEAWAGYEKIRGPLDDPNELKAMLRGSGILEFRIAAQPGLPGLDVKSYHDTLAKSGPFVERSKDYVWIEVDDVNEWADTPTALAELQRDPVGYFAARRGMVGDTYGGRYFLLLGNATSNSMTHSADTSHWKVADSGPTQDDRGFPAVSFKLDPTGGQLMGRLTGAHLKEQMAIVLDGRVKSAPVIQSRIAGNGMISGGKSGFTQKELDYLISTLKAGGLSASLSPQPVLEITTGPQLGSDNLHSGLKAALGSLIIVAVFMAIYYFFSGLVADFALAANMIIILGIMALYQATWTLPGIAGIVLTIGMAVDANVLIFERVREELANKANIETALRLGYEKALSTIIDANATTFITCLILYKTASADIAGFGLTMMIGICATLFTALFCTRAIFEYYIKWFQPKSLNMLPTTVKAVRDFLSPNVDWIGLRHKFFVFSGALIVIGMLLVFSRGADLLDIQFRGGTQVSFELGKLDDAKEGSRKMMTLPEVRERLDKAAELLATISQRRLKEAEQAVADAQAALTSAQKTHADADAALAAATGDEARKEAKVVAERETQRLENAEFDLEHRQAELAERQQQINEAPKLAQKEATVVTVGETTGAGADVRSSGFSVSTLATDAAAVSDAIKQAFVDVIDVKPKIKFRGVGDGVDAPPLSTVGVPAFAITDKELGKNIGRPDRTDDISGYMGKVAIVLDNMEPAASTDDIEDRIRATRFSPLFEQYGARTVEVIGLDVAQDQSRAHANETLYSSAVVLVADEQTQYQENPESFTNDQGLAATEWRLVRDAMQRDISLQSVNSFSSQISGLMQRQAAAAVVLSLLAIIIYIWIRFGSLRYGVAAIVALVHDVAISLGFIAIAGYLYDNFLGHALGLDPFRIDLALIAAIMTIIGYSLNDTIVVFDRIRENRGRLATATPAIINDSINQTISRTILTSGTTMLAVVVLYIFGGPGVHGFAYAMMVGVFIGTYSSIAVAAPLLLIGAGGGGAAQPAADATKPAQSTPARGKTPAPAGA